MLMNAIVCENDFVDKLVAAGCITEPQRKYLLNTVQPRERNEKLLDFLRRRSVADFNKFIILLANEQPHLAKLLTTDGGEILILMSVHCMLYA